MHDDECDVLTDVILKSFKTCALFGEHPATGHNAVLLPDQMSLDVSRPVVLVELRGRSGGVVYFCSIKTEHSRNYTMQLQSLCLIVLKLLSQTTKQHKHPRGRQEHLSTHKPRAKTSS